MSGDVWAIIGVGVAILCFGGIAYREFRSDIRGLRDDVSKLRDDVSNLRERLAKLEGRLEGPSYSQMF